MDLKDTFKYLVGGYYGVESMDSYDLKEYILKDIEDYIRDFICNSPIDHFDYRKEAEFIKDTMDLKTKLQDSLIVLYKIDAPMELIFMVKENLKEFDQ